MADLTDSLDDDVSSFSGSDALITAFMAEDYPRTGSATTLREAAIELDKAGHGIIVIGDGSDIEGVVSERDILRAVALGVDLDETTVADVESRDLKWALPDSNVGEVVEEMMEGYIRHVLVGEAGELVGVVSMRDLLAAYLD